MNGGKLDAADAAYLISCSQHEVVEEDGGCGELIKLVMGLTQGLKGDENGAHVDRVPGDSEVGRSSS